jgi:hypothetical protein
LVQLMVGSLKQATVAVALQYATVVVYCVGVQDCMGMMDHVVVVVDHRMKLMMMHNHRFDDCVMMHHSNAHDVMHCYCDAVVVDFEI